MRLMRHLKGYHQLFENTQELTQEQRDWLDKCTKGTWEINPQTGLVDIDGSFNSFNQALIDFKGVRFGNVSESFNCSYNILKSLEGAPQHVGGGFFCRSSWLTSLEGAPQHVGGNFDCFNNSLTSLEGAPQHVGGNFDCSNNELTSLEGAPQHVGGYFDCSNNSLTSLEGAPQHFDGYFNCRSNSLTSLEGAPQHVGMGFSYGFSSQDNPISERSIIGVLKRMRDKKISLEKAVAEYWRWIPQGDRVYLAKHNPNLSPEEKRGYEALGRMKTRVI